MAACANKILNKTDNTSRATVSSPVWGDLAYKAWSCNIFNYPSSQVLGTGSFIVLALSFTVTLWSNICFPIYVVFPALINLTSPRGKKSDSCIFTSGNICRFKFYQLYSLMGEFGGEKGKGGNRGNKDGNYFLINQCDFSDQSPWFSDQSAWPVSNEGRILGFQSPTSVAQCGPSVISGHDASKPGLLGDFIRQSYILIISFLPWLK